MEWTKTFFSLSLPYGSDTLVPPSHQYSCNSLPGPLYTCHPHSCLDSVCHSIVRTYRSFYSLCFRKKRNWKIDNFIFPTSRWRLGIRPRKKTLINFCSKFWSRILKASTTSKLMHKPYMYQPYRNIYSAKFKEKTGLPSTFTSHIWE